MNIKPICQKTHPKSNSDDYQDQPYQFEFDTHNHPSVISQVAPLITYYKGALIGAFCGDAIGSTLGTIIHYQNFK
jgi:hypothetical protein